MARTIVVLMFAVAVAAPSARATSGEDGRGAVRVAGICSGGVTASLRLRYRGDAIELRFEVEHSRAQVTWRIALVHERRVAWKGSARTTGRAPAFELRRLLPDLPGADTVTARAWGPRGVVCNATATLADPETTR
jgi:hypothetical protein